MSECARNTGWLLCGEGASFVVRAVYFVILARMMGPTEYGILAGAFAFSTLVSQFGSLGAGTVFMRYVTGAPEKFAPYWGNVLLSTITCGSVLTGMMYVLAKHVLDPAGAAIVLVSTIANCVFAQITLEIGRIFQAFGQMRVMAALNFLTNGVRLSAALVILVTLRGVNAWQWSFVALGVSGLSACAAIIAVTARFGRPIFMPRLLFIHGSEGFGYAFAMSTSTIYNDLDKTILSHYGMNWANGIYSLAYRVVDIASIPLFSLREAILPKLFRVGRSGIEESASLSFRVLRVALPAGLVAACGMLVAAPLVPMLLGRAFADSAVATRWLCLIPVFRSLHHTAGGALTGGGYQPVRTAAQLSAALLNIVLNLWLIPRYGWEGAAYASLMTDGALALLCWALLQITREKAREETALGVS